MTPRLTGWLVHTPTVTVWIQSGRSHAWARTTARRMLAGTSPITGSTRVVDGKPGPRRPA